MGAFISKPSSNKRELPISAAGDDGHLAKRLKPTNNFDGAPSEQGATSDDETVVTSNIEVAPSLSALPDSLLVHVLQYLAPQKEKQLAGCLQTFLAIDCTCRSLHNVLGKDEVWKDVFPVYTPMEFEFNTSARERVFIIAALRRIKHEQKSTDSIILRSLAGKDDREIAHRELNRIVQTFCEDKLSAHYKVVLQETTMCYLAAIVGLHIIDKLKKANQLVVGTRSSKDKEYPQVCAKHLTLLDSLLDTESTGYQVDIDYCRSIDLLGEAERQRMVRILAYRAGIVKMSDEAFSIIANEVLQIILSLVADAVTTADSQSQNNSSDFEDVDTEVSVVYAPLMGQPDENGKVECIIIPRQIKDAAVRNGLKPMMGCGIGSHAVEHYNESSESEDEEEVCPYVGLSEDEMGQNTINMLEIADTLGSSLSARKRTRRRLRQARRRNAAIAATAAAEANAAN